ncbi:hypothetical protein ACFLS8_05710, partial [Chloroflexota bacterium]
KSLGIRRDSLTFDAIIQSYREYSQRLNLIEDLKEGRYIIARNPNGKIFRLKYYDVIAEEIWLSYGHVHLEVAIKVDEFHYHEVIEKTVKSKGEHIDVDYAPFFERFWPFQVSFQYLVKRNHPTSLKYQYSVTHTDLANILSIIFSMKSNELTTVPLVNMLQHFIAQPIRDKDVSQFIGILTGNNGKIPIIFKTDGSVIIDRRTLLLFFILMCGQVEASNFGAKGEQRMALLKQQAGSDFMEYLRGKLEEIGYSCLPPSTEICKREYDLLAFSESNQEILLAEAKFTDPSPSSFSAKTLIEQEFILKSRGLLPQVQRQQERHDLIFQNPKLFRERLGLKRDVQRYEVKAYFITKHTPLISKYGQVQVMTDKKFTEEILRPN